MARTTARNLAGRAVAAARSTTATSTAVVKKTVTRKTTAQQATVEKTATKPVAKKAAKKAPAKKAPAKTTVAKKTAAKKTLATKAPAKKTPVKPAPGRKAPAKKAPVTKTTAAATRTVKAPAGRAPAKKLAVKAGEKPWTKAELDEVRGDLFADRERLRSELNLAEHEVHDLMHDAGDGAGNDPADVGSTTFERDHEMSLANNARAMLAQTERALERIEDGSYGLCESCGEPIGKMRVMAFPRATLCLSCKQREERR